MIDDDRVGISTGEPLSAARVGWCAAVLTAVLTVVTFGFAITALPNAGAGCMTGCFEYPYLDTLAEFPRDYFWMPLAIVLVLVYVVFMASIHAYAAPRHKLLSQIALSFAMMSAGILAGAYFVQLSVVPVSLMSGETEGITLLTQYNPHGTFIVLEELGYLLMSLSFLFIAPAFTRRSRVEAAVRWVFLGGFVLTVIALVVISASYGLDRQDRFEVAVISIDWLVLLLSGLLVSVVFRRQLASQHSPQVALT